MKILLKLPGLKFLAVLMATVLLGTFAAFGGAAAPAVAAVFPLFVVPDAYATIPGSYVDTGGDKDVAELSGSFSATLFGATCKIQGSDDATAINNGNWVDLLCLTTAGAPFGAVDIAVAVGTTVGWTLERQAAAGAAGLTFKTYRAQAKNTVGASVANVVGAIFGQS